MAFWKKSEDPWDIDPNPSAARLQNRRKKPPVCWIPSGGIGTLCGRNGQETREKSGASAGEVPLVRQGHGAGLPLRAAGAAFTGTGASPPGKALWLGAGT